MSVKISQTLAAIVNTDELAARAESYGLPADTKLEIYLAIRCGSVSQLAQAAVNLTRGEINKHELDAIIFEIFPSDKKTAHRRGAHFLSLCRTGKIECDYAVASFGKIAKPTTLATVTAAFERLSEDDRAAFLAAIA